MSFLRPTLVAAAAVLLVAGTALAQTSPAEMAVKARQGLMFNYAFNLGVLGGMAKGAIPYDAAKAQAAADNLSVLSNLDESGYWPEGSDHGTIATSRALPEIWAKPAAFKEHLMQLQMGTANMKGAAGKGQEALREAMNSVGGACGGCHKAFRQPN